MTNALPGLPDRRRAEYVPSVQASPGGQGRWWVSPAIPTIANVALAALWGFSALGGWGTSAFCGDETTQQICADRIDLVISVSGAPAAMGAALALGSWAVPRVRRDADRLDTVLSLAAILWIIAGAILFVGGYLAQP
jgi:hypothetical protein